MFGDIAAARAALGWSEKPQPKKLRRTAQLDSALSRLLVIVENYPQLKSNENFQRLQDELAGTENRIAVERRRYNEVVQDYNTYISLFPNSLVASSPASRETMRISRPMRERGCAESNFNYSKPAPQRRPRLPAPAHP